MEQGSSGKSEQVSSELRASATSQAAASSIRPLRPGPHPLEIQMGAAAERLFGADMPSRHSTFANGYYARASEDAFLRDALVELMGCVQPHIERADPVMNRAMARARAAVTFFGSIV